MISKINAIIKEIDLFGAEIKLNIHKQEKFKTLLGGISSIFMIAILFYIGLSNLLNIIKKSEYKLIEQRNILYDPKPHILDVNNFMFAIKIDNPLSSVFPEQKQFYKTEITAIKQVLGDDGIRTREITESFILETCTQPHFSAVTDKESSVFSIIDQYLCLPLDFKIALQGTFNSKDFQYGKIKIKKCSGSEQCYTDEEFDALSINQGFSLSTLIISSVFDSFNKESATTNQIYSDFYLQTTKLHEQYTDFFLEPNESIINNSIYPFFDDRNYNQFWTVRLANTRTIENVYEVPSTFFTINLRIAQEYTLFTKRYQKLDEFVSYLGGMMKFFTFLFGLAIYYNRFGLQIQLANELYNFNLPERSQGQGIKFTQESLNDYIQQHYRDVTDMIDKFKKKSLKLIYATRLTSLWKSSKRFNLVNESPMKTSTINYQNTELMNDEKQLKLLANSFLNKIFERIVSTKTKLTIGYTYFLNILFCRKIDLITDRYSNILIRKGQNMIKNDLDISNILSRIQEIDKLKRVIFNRNQIKLFEYMPPPIITVNDQSRKININKSRKNHHFISKRKKFDSILKLEKLYRSYIKVNQDKDVFNEKLIKLIGDDLVNIFDKAKELESTQEKVCLNINGFNQFDPILKTKEEQEQEQEQENQKNSQFQNHKQLLSKRNYIDDVDEIKFN